MTLRCHLPDGACGLPGNRTVRAIYEIKNTTLQLTIEATSDADTVFNATSHAYWALDDRGDLKAHRLKIPSTRYLEFDAETVPTGSILNAQGGNLDFSSARSPVDGPALDACFCLSDTAVDTIRPVLTLHSKQTNLRLNISSNQPGVVVYSAAGMPSFSNVAQTPEIGPFSGIAIEAQGWPDANNHTSFPSIDLKSKTVLKQITHFSLEMP